MSGNVPCDCCGKLVDERSLAFVESPTPVPEGCDPTTYMVCQACNSYYEPAELIEKIEAENRT